MTSYKWLFWYVKKTTSIDIEFNKTPTVICSIVIQMPTRLVIKIQDVLPKAINFYLLELWCPWGVRSKHQWPCPIWNPNIWHYPKPLLRPFVAKIGTRPCFFLIWSYTIFCWHVQWLWLWIQNFRIIVNTLTHNISSFENNSKLNKYASSMFLFQIWQQIFLQGLSKLTWHNHFVLGFTLVSILMHRLCPSRLMDKKNSLPLGCLHYVWWLKNNSVAIWLVTEFSISCH